MPKSIKTIKKSNWDMLDYDVSLAKWFKSIPDDEIREITISITNPIEADPKLVVGPYPHPRYVLMGEGPWDFKIWLGGGTPRIAPYDVNIVVRTNADRMKEVLFRVQVID